MRTNGVRPIGLMLVRAIAVGLAIVGGLASMARPAHAADSVQLGFVQTLGDSAVELFIDNVSAGTLGPSEGVLLDIEQGEHTLAVRSVDDDTATEELATVDLEVDVDIEVGDPQLLVAPLGPRPLTSMSTMPQFQKRSKVVSRPGGPRLSRARERWC